MHILLPCLIAILDIAAPCVLLLWVWKSRAKTRFYFVSLALCAAAYLIAVKISILGYWHAIGLFLPNVYLLVLGAVLISRYRVGFPAPMFPARGSTEFVLSGVNVGLASLWVLLVVRVFQSHTIEEATLQLSAPLRGENFWIISGGANHSVNQHSRAVRYALDIAQLNAFGLRARSLALFPEDLARYEIYGAEVIAPCAGEIIHAEGRVPDQPPLHPNTSGWGNYVALYCQGRTVRLLHLQPGSVRVVVGEMVATGQLLARVGNSGNTVEPHLHIDAVAGRRLIDPRNDGGMQSVPIEINRRFLVKGDSVNF